MAGPQEFLSVERGTDGAIDAYCSRPPEVPKSGIIIVQEVFGVTQAMRDIADDLAKDGHLVLVPDLFWRLERRVELGNGEDAVLRDKALNLLSRFDVEAGVEDLAACADYLRSLLPAGSKVGIVGFCIGGRMAGLVAARGSVDAACAFYGVGLDRYIDRLATIVVPVQFHFGEKDTHISADVIELVRRTVEQSGNSDASVTTYPGAGHAFYNRHRLDSYDPGSAAVARVSLRKFLGVHLG